MSYAKSPIFSGAYGLPENKIKVKITRVITKTREQIGTESIQGRLVPIIDIVVKSKVTKYEHILKGKINPWDHIARRKKGGTMAYDNTLTKVNSFVDSGKVKPKKWSQSYEDAVILHKENQRSLEK
jgi:hypothetical protein